MPAKYYWKPILKIQNTFDIVVSSGVAFYCLAPSEVDLPPEC